MKSSLPLFAAVALLGASVPAAHAQSFTNLHSFSTPAHGTNSDGAYPIAALVLSGNTLYGTAEGGGKTGFGTVFSVHTDGTAFSALYSFTNGSDGAYPYASLTLSGNALYGTASAGGSAGNGTVFVVKTNGTGFSNLHSFTPRPGQLNADGADPYAGLVLSGNTLYGTAAEAGNAGNGSLFAGTVFAVNTDGTGFSTLHSFSDGGDGGSPYAGLILSGNTLYGTAAFGGATGDGAVFAVNTNASGFSTVYSFTAASPPAGVNSDGASPRAGLILSGNTLYGTALEGGTARAGTVFAVNTNGAGFTNLHSFTGGSDGNGPVGGLVLSGNILYGTALQGGASGFGAVFAVHTDGSGFTNLYSFTGGNDGAYPDASLVLSGNTLYGTASEGGNSGSGTVFSLTLPAALATGHVCCVCDSNAIAGASVQIGAWSTATDSSGAYAIGNLLPGTYTATISAASHATLTTNLTVPSGATAVTNDFYLTNLTLVINPAYDPSIATNPSAAAISNSVESAIRVYRESIANAICLTILFSTTNNSGELAESAAAYAAIPYAQFLADLQANPNKSSSDNAALASLPAGPGAGINGNSQVVLLTAASLLAIGEPALASSAVAAGNAGGYDGVIKLNPSVLATLQTAAAHGINEILGIGGWGSSLNWVAAGNSLAGDVAPLDLFRYSAHGSRSFSTGSSAAAYFSINGGLSTNVWFNQDGAGDFGNWGDGRVPADGVANTPPQVQDAFASGTAGLGSNELIALDVIGYTLQPAPPALQNPARAGKTFTFSWNTMPGLSYQAQFTTNLNGSVWNNLGSPITAGGLVSAISDTGASDSARFYQVLVTSPAVIPSLSSYRSGAFMTLSSGTNTPLAHHFLRAAP